MPWYHDGVSIPHQLSPGRRSRFRGVPGMIALLGLLGTSLPAQAQRLTLEADQEVLTTLLRRQMGSRWVLLRFRHKDRLVLERPRLEVLPRGIYLLGTLRSLTPEVEATVELRIVPQILGTTLRVSPDRVTVLQPSGALGFVPRQLLTGWLRSEAGRRELQRFVLELGPLLQAIGEPGRMRVHLRLGFGSLRLVVAMK